MVTTKMNQSYERLVASFCGGVGGFSGYMLNVIMDKSYGVEMLRAVITAIACAAAGLAVRELWSLIKKKIRKYKNSKNKQ